MGTFLNRSDILKILFVLWSLYFNQTLGKQTPLFTENVIAQQDISGNSTRDGKLLPFLALVNVAQSQCTVGQMTGTCVKRSVCTSMMGVDLGTCGGGFGTCCQIKNECTANPVVVTTNLVRLTPGAEFHNLCRYVIQKPTSKKAGEICQIRLDFDKFMIAEGPDTKYTGDCDVDTLTISGQTNAKLGTLCGNLNNQRMYLNYGDGDKINLDIFMMDDVGQSWDILVTQIKCNSPDLAPPGCLQYFTEQRGTVRSLNFGHQLNNQDYSICVRTNPSMKTITWRTCGGDKDFGISGDSDTNAPGVGGMTGDLCTLDFVMIYGDKRYCGTWFEGSVSTTAQPFMMNVHFDDIELGLPPLACPRGCDTANPGFCLIYSQSPNA